MREGVRGVSPALGSTGENLQQGEAAGLMEKRDIKCWRESERD